MQAFIVRLSHFLYEMHGGDSSLFRYVAYFCPNGTVWGACYE